MKHGEETVGRPARLCGHQEASGFLLDRMRRRARPRNRQTRKSSCQPWKRRGHAEPPSDWFWPHRHRSQRSRRSGPAQPLPMASLGRAHWNSLAVSKRARSAIRGTTFNPSQRSTETMTAVSSRRRSVWLGIKLATRRDDGQRRTGSPAASCANRFGNSLRIAHCRSAVAPLHSPISARVRPQPVQSPARVSSAQTSTQGDFGRSIIASRKREAADLPIPRAQSARQLKAAVPIFRRVGTTGLRPPRREGPREHLDR